MTDPGLVRAYIAGLWYPVRIVRHWHTDRWLVEGHALPPRFRRLGGGRRTTVRAEDLRDLQGQALHLKPPEREEFALGSEPHVHPINSSPSLAASPDRGPAEVTLSEFRRWSVSDLRQFATPVTLVVTHPEGHRREAVAVVVPYALYLRWQAVLDVAPDRTVKGDV